jgi:ELWxxDGT repeat protein
MRRSTVSTLLAAGLAGLASLAGAPAGALTPYRVKDIDTSPAPASSSPRDFWPAGRFSFFHADADGIFAGAGAIWRSDGTAAGTFPFVSDCGDCRVRQFYVFGLTGNLSFFVLDRPSSTATGGPGGSELWVTHGQPWSTFRLAEFPGAGPGPYAVWIPSLRRLFFGADDGIHGNELWTSDGTALGTSMVADLVAGPGDAAPSGFAFFRGEVFFSARDGQGGGGLWKTDGTARGTVEVWTTGSGFPYDLAPVGGRLIFFIYRRDFGLDLWASDGTSRGTARATELPPAGGPYSIDYAVVAGGQLFLAIENAQGVNLWATDGSRKRTRKLTAFRSHPGITGQGFLQPWGNRVAFTADDGVHGEELWTSDGSSARLVSDLCPGKCSSRSVPWLPLGNRLLFAGDDGVHGEELWSTDGTRAGTSLIADLCPGSCDSFPYAPMALGNAIVFAARGSDLRPRLWRTDGTAAGTVLLFASPDISLWNDEFQGTRIGNLLLFEGADTDHGRELWRSDGTAAGTYLVEDIATANFGGSQPREIHAAGGRAFFLVSEPDFRPVLWTSDGNDAGTYLLRDFGPLSGFAGSLPAAAVGGTLYFFLNSSLWKTDGTTAGTLRVTPDSVQVGSEIAAAGSTVFFLAGDGAHDGPALWKSDGTAAGTGPVDPVGWTGGTATHLTASGGWLYYFLQGGAEAQLWRTDGTPAGTAHVADIGFGLNDENPPLLAELGGRLYFFALKEPFYPFALRLWSTDGTEAGTREVTDLGLGPTDYLFPQGLAAAGGKIFVSAATSPGSGSPVGGLWVTDGTVAGTRQIGSTGFVGDRGTTDFGGRLVFAGPGGNPSGNALWTSDGTAAGTQPLLAADGQSPGQLESFSTFAGRLIFAATGGPSTVLWQSDGTAAGTQPVLTLGGEGNGLGRELVVAGSRLFFRAVDAATGDELWALRPD